MNDTTPGATRNALLYLLLIICFFAIGLLSAWIAGERKRNAALSEKMREVMVQNIELRRIDIAQDQENENAFYYPGRDSILNVIINRWKKTNQIK